MSQPNQPEEPPVVPVSTTPVGHSGTHVEVSERPGWTAPGGFGLVGGLVLLMLAVIAGGQQQPVWLAVGALLGLAGVLILTSLIVIAPGQTRVVQFFGKYVGTVRRQGLSMVPPLTTRRRVNVRVNNFETNRLKVNDADGNPVEIAAIVVWQVADTSKAVFAVQDYLSFVSVQSEAALRHVATTRPYDGGDDAQPSLRGNTDDVAAELAREVAARIAVAGVEIVEVRISHLAYAPEIAQVMLQRQQAAAVISARSRIVEGAVGMVEMALNRMTERNIVELDDERRAAMVSNLLVILCGDSRATPIVNTGTLYQ
jgi:regulator of protease activity HflC (stomatin/prohibitin superfamily)